MSDETKKLSFEDAKSVIESCYGFDDATTPAGEAWAIVNDKIATLEKRLAEATKFIQDIADGGGGFTGAAAKDFLENTHD